MASDVTLSIPQELSMFPHLRTMQFVGTERPWLNLYGIRVRPVAPFGSVSSRPFVDPALLHRCLPDELLMEAAKQARLEKFEIPSKIKLVPEAWTPESGLVTAALKLKRENVRKAFAEDLTKLYA